MNFRRKIFALTPSQRGGTRLLHAGRRTLVRDVLEIPRLSEIWATLHALWQQFDEDIVVDHPQMVAECTADEI